MLNNRVINRKFQKIDMVRGEKSMRDGFYIHINEQGKLVQEIVKNQTLQISCTDEITSILISYTEYDFSLLRDLISALWKSEIFEESLDIRYSDFEACKNGCELITEEMDEPVSAIFVQKELERINRIPDDDSASFLIYQARHMVDALMIPIAAHTFLHRAFEILYLSDDAMLNRVKTLYRAYPGLRNHAFLEAFEFIEPEDESATPVLRKRYLIETLNEFFFFCFIELICRDVDICCCQCCGYYFTPKTKKETLYCDRIIKDGKTCKEMAPKLKQKVNEENDPALKEYTQLKNMYKSRAERYENRTDFERERTSKDLTYDEFYLWSTNAAVERSGMLRGRLRWRSFWGG